MRYLFYVSVLLAFISCEKNVKKHIPKSNGRLNYIAVVSSKPDWGGNIGEALREVFQRPLQGLPTKEPTFSMHHVPTNVFKGTTRVSRNIIAILKGKPPSVKLSQNVFAKPQNIVYIQGENDEEIKKLISENSEKIQLIFKTSELAEESRIIKEQMLDVAAIEKSMGVHLDIPSTYKIVKTEDNFFWLERPLPKSVSNKSNLIIYNIPLKLYPKAQRPEKISALRDSIGKTYIPGREKGMYMITESNYVPDVKEMQVNGRNALETRGIWEVKNFLMAGPFINYIVEDKKHSRAIVVEGFVFAPSINKRDVIFELEVIAKSLTFIEKEH